MSELFSIELFLPKLLSASTTTVLLAVLSMPLAIIFGLFLALMRLSQVRILRWIAAIYIEIVRGTPLLVQLYLVYYLLPQLGLWLETDLLTLPNFAVGVICLAGNYAAYEAEIHRAALLAIDKGQHEAGLALGLTPSKTFNYIILPQSLRISTPPMVNDLIAMLKDTCLVSIIGVQELLNVAIGIGKSTFQMPLLLAEASLIYLLLSLPCYYLGKWVEQRLGQSTARPLEIRSSHGH